MKLPHPPQSASRFFARPLSGVLECPRCGRILYFNSAGAGGRVQNAHWNRRTSQLGCPECGLQLVIGLIAWPTQPGGGTRTIPRDQVPQERQLAQLRAMGGEGAGWWMPKTDAKPARRPDDTNVTARCSCRPGVGWVDPACPVHPPEAAEGPLIPELADEDEGSEGDPWPR